MDNKSQEQMLDADIQISKKLFESVIYAIELAKNYEGEDSSIFNVDEIIAENYQLASRNPEYKLIWEQDFLKNSDDELLQVLKEIVPFKKEDLLKAKSILLLLDARLKCIE